jgi:hypothetical protein
LTGAGATSISGTYPNFTITSTNTTYALATSTTLGLIELGSDTAQTVAANAVTATASRTYALQVNAAGQGVINVPWTDTNSGGTVTSVGGTGTVSGLTLSGTVTTSGNLTLGGTLSLTSGQVTTALGFTPIALASAITGYTVGANTALAATDTVLAAFGKLQGQVNARGTGTVTSVSGTGTASGLSLSGTVTTSGNITLSGTVNSLAAGTYGISISGNAATATSATNQSGGTVNATSGSFTALITGASSASTNVNTANDTGSISIRGSASTVASMSFHRTGAYAINMGLGTDNVFRIGGWSASADAFRMDGGGTLTMLGNVSANSDERIKTNWRSVQDNFVSKLAKVKSGIYDRTDQELTQAGVSAQSLQTLLPETVNADSDGLLNVAYGNAALISAIELAKIVEELRAEIAELKLKIKE